MYARANDILGNIVKVRHRRPRTWQNLALQLVTVGARTRAFAADHVRRAEFGDRFLSASSSDPAPLAGASPRTKALRAAGAHRRTESTPRPLGLTRPGRCALQHFNRLLFPRPRQIRSPTFWEPVDLSMLPTHAFLSLSFRRRSRRLPDRASLIFGISRSVSPTTGLRTVICAPSTAAPTGHRPRPVRQLRCACQAADLRRRQASARRSTASVHPLRQSQISSRSARSSRRSAMKIEGTHHDTIAGTGPRSPSTARAASRA